MKQGWCESWSWGNHKSVGKVGISWQQTLNDHLHPDGRGVRAPEDRIEAIRDKSSIRWAMREKKGEHLNNLNHFETGGAEKLKKMKIEDNCWVWPLSMITTIKTHNIQRYWSLRMRPRWHSGLTDLIIVRTRHIIVINVNKTLVLVITLF